MNKSILILTSEFPPQSGGIGNHAYNLAKGLQKNNYQVTVLSDIRSENGQAEKEFDKNLGFKVIRTPRKKILLFSYFKRFQTAFILTRSNEIILSSGKFSLWLGAFLSLFINRKFVAVVHGSEIKLRNTFLRKITHLSLKRFNKIIAVSNYTKSLLPSNIKNIEVIFNGFNMKMPNRPLPHKDPMPVLITVGNVTKRKGQENIINAIPNVLKKYPDLKYHIVGIPTEMERLKKLCLKLGVEKSVVFEGEVSEKLKIKLLQTADIFVMLSQKTKTGDVEGFGIAILEANILGLPAIGAKNCGIEDAIQDGVSGKLIDNKDIFAFEKALEEILNNYDSYSKGAKVWARNFTWERVIKKYLKVLRFTFKGN